MITLDKPVETISLPVGDIRIDGGTQSRTAINQDKVREYAALLEDGITFPAVVVYYDGCNYWLADGFHRLNATILAFGVDGSIAVDIRQGTCRDAVLHSVGANSRHGLPRSNADKRVAVLRLLQDTEWGDWPDQQIARICGVAVQTVAKIRAELFAEENQGKLPLSPADTPVAPTEGKRYPTQTQPSPRTVAAPNSYQPIPIDDDFASWEITRGQLVIATAEDSVSLNASQALELLEYLEKNKQKLEVS